MTLRAETHPPCSCCQKTPVEMVALINDTTGTLIASSYVDQATRAGIIFGTGCNAAYMEKVANIPKIKHLNLPEDAEVRTSHSSTSARKGS